MLPPKILNRDPRSRRDRAEAFRIITECTGSVNVTSKTHEEIGSLAREHPKMVVNDDVKDAIGIAHFFFVDEGLMFRDNRISKCADCRIPLQFRPHFVNVPTLLCCFCAGDRLLKEYWDSKKD